MKLLDVMIRTGRLDEFVTEFVSLRNEEQQEKALWEVWLHKCFDKSFDEFRRFALKEAKKAPTKEEIEGTINDAFNILTAFDPVGGAKNGDLSNPGDGGDQHGRSAASTAGTA